MSLLAGLALALVALTLITAPAWARVRHNDAWARQQFARAERLREALNGLPVNQRTGRGYQRVIDAYRRVYFGSPSSSKADPSVVATAELMVEMGRRFDDDKILRGAVNEYRFLRKEYPGSKYRFDALFTIGEIYKDDLRDPEEARKAFEDFLHRYPRNRLAEDARAALKEIDDAAASEKEQTARAAAQGHASGKDAGASSSESPSDNGDTSPALRRRELPRVTGVRHWSTPDYTRVAIDVEREVKFGSQQIANPDRIFFDLLDTKLASTLVGKTFDVDDGFLKKVRVAEFKPGRTRIVLEVDDLSSYDAFLLPDPYRLIIDIHGKHSRAAELAKTRGENGSSADSPRSATYADAAPPASGEPVSADSASSDAAREPSDLTAEAEQKERVQTDARVQTEEKHAIVARAEPAKTEKAHKDPSEWDDTPASGVNATSGASGSGTSGGSTNGLVKTTVALKGTDRRIPKTIAEPDDDSPSRSAKNRRAAQRGQTAGPASTPVSPSNTSGSNALQSDESAEQTKNSNGDAGNGGSTQVGSSPNSVSPYAKSRSPSDPSSPVATQSLPGAESASLATESAPASAPTSRTKSGHKKKSQTSSAAPDTADLVGREARPTAAGDRSLTRALGLKIGKIVIDAGHGGHDTGTIGPNGLLEKDLVLDVAKRLGRLLEARLGAEVVYTRRDDTFVPLETRTAIANRERADLFISIHANSSRDDSARGVETYYLNFTSSPEALEVAARENAVSEKSIHELQDLVKKIALKEKIDESREFASDVQESLFDGLALSGAGIRNRGVKKAPFIVLIGANMPSILAEVSFVSNPTDERKLETSEHRQRIAESLYRGVARYAGGLSGVKVASRIDRSEARATAGR